MKTILLLTSVVLTLTASRASAAPGLDAGWSVAGVPSSGCPVNPNSFTDMSDLCNDNLAGPYKYALAVKAPAGITKWVGEEFFLDFHFSAPTLPDWWHLEAAYPSIGVLAGCRDGSYSFSTVRGIGTTTTCKDYWGVDPQSGGTVWQANTPSSGRARMVGTFACATSTAFAVTADVEYYVGSGSFDMNHTVADVGVAICYGCQIPACFVFSYLKIIQPAGTLGGDVIITNPNVRQYLTWQGGPVGSGCLFVSPTRRATWGQVKSLYR